MSLPSDTISDLAASLSEIAESIVDAFVGGAQPSDIAHMLETDR